MRAPPRSPPPATTPPVGPRRGLAVLGLGHGEPAGGVRGTAAASAAARRAAATRLRARPNRSRTAPASRRARASAASSAAQPLAQSHTRICAAEGGAPRQAVPHGLIGVRPPALPQRELREVGVVDPSPWSSRRVASAASRRARAASKSSADLDVGTDDEEHVGVVGGDGASAAARGGRLVHSPIASRASIRLETITVLSMP